MPLMNTISISGYHIREAGATAVQSIAFTMSNAIAYFQTAMDAGLGIDDFVGQTTFHGFGGGIEVLKELASRRAARRVWAKIMRDRMQSKMPEHWIYRENGGGLVGCRMTTIQRPLNNAVRIAIGAAFSAMIGDLPTINYPYDEPLGLGHSIEARQLATDAARIIVEELKLADVRDPFAGSYYIESLTNRYEAEIFALIEEIDKMGGAVKAVESGWMKSEIMASADNEQRQMQLGEIVQVGVNKYTDEITVMTPRTSPYAAERRESAEERQIANLQQVKRERDGSQVQRCLEQIENAARDEKANLIPFFIEAVKAYATIGEICGVLRRVFGEAR